MPGSLAFWILRQVSGPYSGGVGETRCGEVKEHEVLKDAGLVLASPPRRQCFQAEVRPHLALISTPGLQAEGQ